jgi:cysteine synthase A
MSRAGLLDRLSMVGRAMPRTPLVHLAHDRLELYAKLEYVNPNGSSKDRSAYWILRRAVERGDITERSTVVESSSGNFAISLASFCRWLGIAFVPVIDPNTNAATEAFLRRLCDRVEKVTERDDTGGYLTNRLLRVQQVRGELPGAYWPNQYGNLDAVEAHDQLTGRELTEDLPDIDYLFVGVSTGGTVAGMSARLKRVNPATRVVAVDAEGSVIFGGPPAARRLPGLGSSMVPPLVTRALIDDVRIVPEVDAVRGCHDLLDRHGLYAGGSTGSVYRAIEDYFADHHGPRPTVAFICADRGTGYADTIYDLDWVTRFTAERAPVALV